MAKKPLAYTLNEHKASTGSLKGKMVIQAIPTTVPPNAKAWDSSTDIPDIPGYTGDIIPNANHFNVDAGLPAPAEMKKYFALPYTANHWAISEEGAYWASTGSPQTGQFSPNPSAAYICFRGSYMWVSTGRYIERPRDFGYCAVKFE